MFYGPGFARLCETALFDRHHVRAAIWSTEHAKIILPFVQRDLAEVVGDAALAGGARDIVSLYGRGGMLFDGSDRDEIEAFHGDFAEWCRDQGIICGFSRYHPVLDNAVFAAGSTEVIDVGNFVVVDLRPSIDDIEAGFKYSMRKAIRKSERAGVTVTVEQNLDHLDTFLDVYHETLERNGARPFYYFARGFYERLPSELPGGFAFYYGWLDGEIVTCELAILSRRYASSFVGGSRAAGLEASANQNLKREMIRDLKGRGCRHFLLGGGQSPDDGVYRYKLAYAPEGARPSLVGGDIFVPDAYRDLKARMSAAGAPMAPNRFQFYDLS